MIDNSRIDLAVCLAVWIALCGLVLSFARRKSIPSVGGPLIYVALLSLNHLFGAAVYALPWYAPQGSYLLSQGADIIPVSKGFGISLLGLFGFVLGVMVLYRIPAKRFAFVPFRRVSPWWLIFSGLLIKVVFTPLLSWIPSMTSILWTGSQLSVIGFLLASWEAWRTGKKKKTAGWVLLAVIFPLATTLSSGFIGYGMVSLIVIVLFMQRQVRVGAWVYTGGVLAMYAGLSLWVTYARDRNELREVVWQQQADLSARLAQIGQTLGSFEWLDIRNQDHLEVIDIRLNQNLLVGQAVENMEAGGVESAKGSTIAFALISWIPRAIWPSKPEFGGSGNMVATYTGRYFDESSSFGVGQIMEFYINFRWLGVLAGMACMGFAITWLDRRAAVCLANRDHWGFVVYFFPMLVGIQPGGALSEVISSAAAAGLLIYFMGRLAKEGGVIVTRRSSGSVSRRTHKQRRIRKSAHH